MGVCVQCGRKSMYMSYGTFDRFRVKIAKAFDNKFGETYEKWLFTYPCSKEERIALDNDFSDVCNSTPELTQELFEFFVASDCEGKINRDTVRQLVPIVEKMDEFTLGYVGVEPYNKQETLEFFRHSIRYGANVTWD